MHTQKDHLCDLVYILDLFVLLLLWKPIGRVGLLGDLLLVGVALTESGEYRVIFGVLALFVVVGLFKLPTNLTHQRLQSFQILDCNLFSSQLDVSITF